MTYGHDEAMRDLDELDTMPMSISEYAARTARLAAHIERLELRADQWQQEAELNALERDEWKQQCKTWEAEYALLKRERDEWEAVARYIVEVLACDHDNCYIDASEDDCERCVSEGSEKWIAFAREQVVK